MGIKHRKIFYKEDSKMIGSENNGMYMPVAPAYMSGCNNNGFGDEWSSWILLFLIFGIFGNGGWGNGFGGNNQLGYDFPWLLNGQNNINANTNNGFRDAMINDGINGIQNNITSGFGDVQTALCGGFAGVNASINGAQNAIAQQLYTNQIADLERSFASQTASTQGFMNLQSQLAQCCCDNRLSSCQSQNLISNEANATRMADATNTRDIIDSNTRSTQAILDKLCQLELDGYKRENDNLRSQLNEANRAASQAAQNTLITQGFANEVDQLYSRLNNCPISTVPVYGKTPIFNCGNGGYAGCGCSGVA